MHIQEELFRTDYLYRLFIQPIYNAEIRIQDQD